MSEQDYPTAEDLAKIEQWPATDIAGCLDFVKALWHYPDAATHDISAHEASVLRAGKQDRYLRLATMGWSGNESIILAMQENLYVQLVAWQLSARGGLHIYRYPEAK